MEIPKQWDIVPYEKLLKKINKLNLPKVEENNTTKKQKDLPPYLLNFNKNDKNRFTAFLVPFDTSKDNLEQATRASIGFLYNRFTKYGIKVDSSWSKEMIGQKEFIKSHITAHYDSTLVDNQISYTRVINNYMLSVTIIYDTNNNRDILLKAWRSSKFEY